MSNLEDVLLDLDRRLKNIEDHLNINNVSLEKDTQIEDNSGYKIQKEEERVFWEPPQKEILNEYIPDKLPHIDSNTNKSSMLGIIGVFFVILSGVFFLKLSITTGWLNPLRQILLAAGVGTILFIAPFLAPPSERKYGAILTGAGTTILHLTWLGAYYIHHLLTAKSALICASLIGIISILTKFDKGFKTFLLVAMAGTYLAAPLLAIEFKSLNTLITFLTIWNISYSAAAYMRRRRDIMFIASYYATFTVALLSLKYPDLQSLYNLIILQVIQFAIFASAMLSYSIAYKNPLTEEENKALFPLLLLFYFSTYHIISQLNTNLASWLGIIVSIIVLALYFSAKKILKSELKSKLALTSTAALTFIHSFYFHLASENALNFLGLITGGIIAYIMSHKPKIAKSYSWPIFIFSCVFIYCSINTIIWSQSWYPIYPYNIAYGAFFLITAIFIKIPRHEKTDHSTPYISALLFCAHLEILLAIYRFSENINWSGSLFVTIFWGVYALLILGIAFWKKNKDFGKSALLILIAVGFKAFFYDLSETAQLVRVLSLLIEGLLLYGCGWLLKRMEKW
ncbi:MAG: DUF2339 domain-containing protein [Bdellovibrionota bacterium]